MLRLLLGGFLLLFTLFAVAGNDNWHYGGRSAGMGHASVTLNDVWSVHHNQAGLALLDNASAGVFYENRFLLKELGYKGFVFAMPTNSGTFGVSLASFGYSQYAENKINLSYGAKLGEKIRGGIGFNYHHLRIGNNYGNASSITFEGGVQVDLVKDLTIAMHIYNPTRTVLLEDYQERIPTIMRMGVQYRFSDKVLTALEVEKDVDYKPNVKFGLEYHPVEKVYLRTGVGTFPYSHSFGVGVNLGQLQVDFSSAYHQRLGISPQISIQGSL